jgi:hypothetical protein
MDGWWKGIYAMCIAILICEVLILIGVAAGTTDLCDRCRSKKIEAAVPLLPKPEDEEPRKEEEEKKEDLERDFLTTFLVESEAENVRNAKFQDDNLTSEEFVRKMLKD